MYLTFEIEMMKRIEIFLTEQFTYDFGIANSKISICKSDEIF